ncbi:MAG TPA: PEP-CTERM sorting domain-containing protein [Burkholderiales bacterium]|nr:PEP-CTERM sorting domain-containing protein [Burkholderiales bacterium]
MSTITKVMAAVLFTGMLTAQPVFAGASPASPSSSAGDPWDQWVSMDAQYPAYPDISSSPGVTTTITWFDASSQSVEISADGSVPEPESLSLLGLALALAGFYRRRRKH